jgi:predicted enzyme related to lactoylglutathione lyase
MGPQFLSALILNSRAPEKLAAFYRDHLGLPFTQRDKSSGDFSCMLGETHFAIHKIKPGKSSAGNAEIGLHFPELDQLVASLESKKVRIVEPIKEYPWARSAEIRDPDGNVIYLMQLPQASVMQIKALGLSLANASPQPERTKAAPSAGSRRKTKSRRR